MHAAPGEIPSSSQQLKLQEPCPLDHPTCNQTDLSVVVVVTYHALFVMLHSSLERTNGACNK